VVDGAERFAQSAEINANARVKVAYMSMSASAESYLSLSGEAEVLDDRALVKSAIAGDGSSMNRDSQTVHF
jgi:general stress protein 26